MRVITGEYKGRRLESPKGNSIRPTSDKVKESIFNLLMDETYGRVFCDLFCGTGSLGIEALSRGASRCYFADDSKESVRLTLRNLDHCNASDKAVVMQCDYSRALERIKEKVDVFLLDPPYRKGLYEKTLSLIDELDLLDYEGIIVAEHDSHQELPASAGDLVKVRAVKYGKTSLSLYRHRRPDSSQSDEQDQI